VTSGDCVSRRAFGPWSSQRGHYFAGAELRPRNIPASDRERAGAFEAVFSRLSQ